MSPPSRDATWTPLLVSLLVTVAAVVVWRAPVVLSQDEVICNSLNKLRCTMPIHLPFVGDGLCGILQCGWCRVFNETWHEAGQRSYSEGLLKTDVTIFVKTPVIRSGGTDSNVYIRLEDEHGKITNTFKLRSLLLSGFQQGTNKVHRIPDHEFPDGFGDVKKVHVWRDNCGISPDWFLERIEVLQPFPGQIPIGPIDGKRSVFPYLRWLPADRETIIYEYDTFLPQDDPNRERRQFELAEKRQKYMVKVKVDGFPAGGPDRVPPEEEHSNEFFITGAAWLGKMLLTIMSQNVIPKHFESIDDVKELFRKRLLKTHVKKPLYALDKWDSDEWFGLQRLQRVEPMHIRLATKIPSKFKVTSEMLQPFLEGQSIEGALAKKKLFIIDLEPLSAINTKEGAKMWAPLVLFYLTEDNKLMPVAIQLDQDPTKNPVFLPSDPKYTWMMAKLFYNNAEAQYHQGVTHLAMAHLVEDGFVVVTHRQLAPSHPIFKLLVPHFLFTMAINKRAYQALINPGGVVDQGMTCKAVELFKLIKEVFPKTPIMQYIDVRNQLNNRGVLDKSVLPYYPYRDNMVALYEVIRKYVLSYCKIYYSDPSKLEADMELKNWRDEIVLSREKGGLGYDDVPGDDKLGFRSAEELAELATAIIATGSIGHGAVHLPMWDEYMFVPNYPLMLRGRPPQDKQERTESDIMRVLPDSKQMTDKIMFPISVLSLNATNTLGDYELQYIYDPPGTKAFAQFRRDISKRSAQLNAANKKAEFKYPYLDPHKVANSINI